MVGTTAIAQGSIRAAAVISAIEPMIVTMVVARRQNVSKIIDP